VFTQLGRVVAAHPVRVLLVWMALAAGVIATANVVLGSAGVSAVIDTKDTDFLPKGYESAQAAALADTAFPQTAKATAVLVVGRADGGKLTAADTATVDRIVGQLAAAGVPTVTGVHTSAQQVSPDGTVQVAQVEFARASADGATLRAVGALRARTAQLVRGTGLRAGYTGDAAFAYDDRGTAALVEVGTVAIILMLLLLIFRAPLVALLTIVGVGVVAVTTEYGLAMAAKVAGFHLDNSTIQLLPIVLFGVGTDYVVFLLYRYRERLRAGADRRTAMATALARVGQAITSSALAVVASLGALLLSLFGSFRVVGLSLAVAVLAMLVTGLTLIPAVFVLTGPRAFWPSRAHRRIPRARLATATGRLVEHRPGVVTGAALVLLTVLAMAALGYRASYDQSPAPRGSESAQALHDLKTGFPAGILNPTEVYLTGPQVDQATAQAYARRLTQQLAGAPAVGGIGQVQMHGNVAQIDVVLSADPSGGAAMDTIERQVRPAAHRAAPPGTRAYVGGLTSVYADVRAAVDRDMRLIFPVAAALIGLILLVMLRGLLAPAYLLAAVVAGFLATLGATVLAFQAVGGAAGLNFNVPLIVYLFVASLGTDYNILMISRIGEEMAEGGTPRQAAARALRQTGPAVAAAAAILAGTFASLTLSDQTAQVGFAVAVGVLLSAFVLSWLIVPALTAMVGPAAFWPGGNRRPAYPAPADTRPVAPVGRQ